MRPSRAAAQVLVEEAFYAVSGVEVLPGKVVELTRVHHQLASPPQLTRWSLVAITPLCRSTFFFAIGPTACGSGSPCFEGDAAVQLLCTPKMFPWQYPSYSALRQHAFPAAPRVL
jgi:hypothetical protein